MGLSKFQELFSRYEWKEIRGCPGRYILKDGICNLPPALLVGKDIEIREECFAKAPDPVFYCRFSGGGLISYRKSNGYLHTLCTDEGMDHKMNDLRSLD